MVVSYFGNYGRGCAHVFNHVMRSEKQRLMTLKTLTTTTTNFNGLFWPLSDLQQRPYCTIKRKMNGDVRLFKRGASVAQLQSPSRILQEPIPMLSFEELSFAENFTTSTKSNLPKIVEVGQVDSVHATIKELIELRDRSTSTLTVERLVKKFRLMFKKSIV